MRSPLLIALGLWWRNNERNYWALLALLPWSCLMALGHLGQHTLVACAVQENISCLFWGFKFLALRAFWSPWWHTTTLSRGTSELELRIPPSCESHSLMRISLPHASFLCFPLRKELLEISRLPSPKLLRFLKLRPWLIDWHYVSLRNYFPRHNIQSSNQSKSHSRSSSNCFLYVPVPLFLECQFLSWRSSSF